MSVMWPRLDKRLSICKEERDTLYKQLKAAAILLEASDARAKEAEDRVKVLEPLVAQWRTDCMQARTEEEDSRDQLGAVRVERNTLRTEVVRLQQSQR